MRLIDADRIIHSPILHTMRKKELLDTIIAAPTIDAAPIIHAKWMYHESENGTVFTCSNCEYTPEIISDDSPYCPYCGAKMDL